MIEPSDALHDVVDTVMAQAAEIAGLDAARAEAWASDVLAFAAEAGVDPDDLATRLAGIDDDGAAFALAALAALHTVPAPTWTGAPPPWIDAIGSSRCVGSAVLRAHDAETIVFRFLDADETAHLITVDLGAGEPETVREVHVGPGDLLDALDEDDAAIDQVDGPAGELAVRTITALAATQTPADSLVANGRLLLRRLADLTDVALDPPAAAEEVVPAPPERDPDDDAYAVELLTSTLGGEVRQETDAATAVARLVAPVEMAPLSSAERDAVRILESADWLGAVIGLVRAGAGTAVDGSTMVDLVNRCPEVTTTIPRSDRPRIEWAFDQVIRSWPALGILDDDHRLTAAGVVALPEALRLAWS